MRIGKRSRFAGVVALLLLAVALNALALEVAWRPAAPAVHVTTAPPRATAPTAQPGDAGSPQPATASAGRQHAHPPQAEGPPPFSAAGGNPPRGPRASAPEAKWPVLFVLAGLGLVGAEVLRRRRSTISPRRSP